MRRVHKEQDEIDRRSRPPRSCRSKTPPGMASPDHTPFTLPPPVPLCTARGNQMSSNAATNTIGDSDQSNSRRSPLLRMMFVGVCLCVYCPLLRVAAKESRANETGDHRVLPRKACTVDSPTQISRGKSLLSSSLHFYHNHPENSAFRFAVLGDLSKSINMPPTPRQPPRIPRKQTSDEKFRLIAQGPNALCSSVPSHHRSRRMLTRKWRAQPMG